MTYEKVSFYKQLTVPMSTALPIFDPQVLLFHCDGTDGSTLFPDSSVRNHGFVTVANAQVDTAQSKFGTGSLLGDGSIGHLLGDGSSDFAFGTLSFTIDFWIRTTSSTSFHAVYDGRPTATEGDYPTVYIDNNNLANYHTDGATRILGTTALSILTWHHIAVTRAGGSTRLFVNGIQEGSTFADATDYINVANRPIIGASGTDLSAVVNGSLDEVHVLKGLALWTSNFTPPAAPYTP